MPKTDTCGHINHIITISYSSKKKEWKFTWLNNSSSRCVLCYEEGRLQPRVQILPVKEINILENMLINFLFESEMQRVTPMSMRLVLSWSQDMVKTGSHASSLCGPVNS